MGPYSQTLHVRYRFKRCFIIIGAMLNIAHGCEMRFSAVHDAFSKHTVYREGYLHLLTTKDGDKKQFALAWAICETKSGDVYEYFSNKCHEADLSRYLSDTSVIFSDRQKGIKKFHDKFQSKIGSRTHANRKYFFPLRWLLPTSTHFRPGVPGFRQAFSYPLRRAKGVGAVLSQCSRSWIYLHGCWHAHGPSC